MHIGFTGTRAGMTPEQNDTAHSLFLLRFDAMKATIHHGCCRGADGDFHHACLDAGVRNFVLHPGDKIQKARFVHMTTHSQPYTFRDIKRYLDRNKDIVNESEVLIATPKTDEEELRSGTWATIRYARRIGRPVLIIWPDGTLEVEHNKKK